MGMRGGAGRREVSCASARRETIISIIKESGGGLKAVIDAPVYRVAVAAAAAFINSFRHRRSLELLIKPRRGDSASMMYRALITLARPSVIKKETAAAAAAADEPRDNARRRAFEARFGISNPSDGSVSGGKRTNVVCSDMEKIWDPAALN
ncbi:hypothetical protein EVAR_66330_1 [Eumeta japonica]|uniref:Uncharacterized protein n=1 Tax=Eumeta variegata TaxID=151549 RepID=A0A4C1Z3Z8_EUMVA|nr:hypothetical protein EVAR_66330_1 [Eumeta japonica]